MNEAYPRELKHKVNHIKTVLHDYDKTKLAVERKRAHLKDKIRLPFIASGRHRHTFELSDEYVLKVGNPPSNEKEVNAWESVPEDVKKYFCPVVDYAEDYTWVVMRRADDIRNFSDLSKDQCCDIEMELEQKMMENNVIIYDVITKNIGMLDDEPVIIDYAEFVDIDPTFYE